MDIGLIKTAYRELLGHSDFVREAEPELIMDNIPAVEAYTEGGKDSGTLSGTYLYHLSKTCSLLSPNDRVLDLGCGSGILLSMIAQLNPQCQFLGVDLSLPMLEKAKKISNDKGLFNISFREEDICQLSTIKDNSIDVLCSSMALHHLPDLHHLNETFKQISRVLKPGGFLYINDFGKLKKEKSIDYFVSRSGLEQNSILAKDYYYSLKAAFSIEEFKKVVSDNLSSDFKVFSTPISPVSVVITNGKKKKNNSLDNSISKMYQRLPKDRKSDFNQLKLFLRISGLNF